jgi:hypothetical protein
MVGPRPRWAADADHWQRLHAIFAEREKKVKLEAAVAATSARQLTHSYDVRDARKR